MYSNTSGYVHTALRLDWGKAITGQYTLSPNSYPNPRSDSRSGWEGRGLKHNPCPAQSGPWNPANRGESSAQPQARAREPRGSKANRQWLPMLP